MEMDMNLRSTGYNIQVAVRNALRSHLYHGMLGDYPDAERLLINKQSWSISEWCEYWSRWYDEATIDTDFYAVDGHKEKFLAGLDDVAVSCGIAIYEDGTFGKEKWVNFDRTRWIERSDRTNMATYHAEELAKYLVETGAVASVAEVADDTTVEVQVTVEIQPSKSDRLVASSVMVLIRSESTDVDSVNVLTLK